VSQAPIAHEEMVERGLLQRRGSEHPTFSGSASADVWTWSKEHFGESVFSDTGSPTGSDWYDFGCHHLGRHL